jgi:hypothetical protein
VREDPLHLFEECCATQFPSDFAGFREVASGSVGIAMRQTETPDLVQDMLQVCGAPVLAESF